MSDTKTFKLTETEIALIRAGLITLAGEQDDKAKVSGLSWDKTYADECWKFYFNFCEMDRLAETVPPLSAELAANMGEFVTFARFERTLADYRQTRGYCIECGAVDPCEHSRIEAPTVAEIVG